MRVQSHIMAYDIGTTGAKACLYDLENDLALVDSEVQGYPIIRTADGGVEQKVEDWWRAVCTATQNILARTGQRAESIAGIAFCCQMQALILVDRHGTVLRNPMSYMDGRATGTLKKHLSTGLFKIKDLNAVKTLKALRITGGMAATAKDPLWKYHWVRENEPAVFSNVYKWLDVRDYLALRCTGRFAMTQDSANLTFLYDTRPGNLGWSKSLCRTFDVDPDHLAQVHWATDIAGELKPGPALELGLVQGTPVFGGGGDATLIPIGAGCLDLYDTHIYVGTSGWVVSNVDRRIFDISNFMTSLMGGTPSRYNLIAEQETSGICMQWVRDHLALGDIRIDLQDTHQDLLEINGDELYDLMNRKVNEVPPGSGGVIFTPWLHGNRAPKEDPHARGMFFNISLGTGKRALIRSVLEGIAYHKRWMIEAMEKKIPKQNCLRLVGGGAKSEVLCQILADVTGHRIEIPEDPQNAGALGAAIVCALGLKAIPSIQDAKRFVSVQKVYEPHLKYKKIYDKQFTVFKQLYKKNKKLFGTLNTNNII